MNLQPVPISETRQNNLGGFFNGDSLCGLLTGAPELLIDPVFLPQLVSGAFQRLSYRTEIVHRTAILSIVGALYSADYEQIRADFDALLANEQVSQIVLHISSPGGAAHGVMDLSDHIYAARGTKPMIAVAEYACSAAFAIASAADEIVLSRTASVGSVGCC